MYKLNYPVRRGHITDYDAIEELWKQSFKQLGVETPQRHSIMLIKRYSGNEGLKEISQILFENMNFGSMFIGIPAVCALWGTGKLNGMVCDIGAGYTHCAPVLDGNPLYGAVKYYDVAGLDIDRALLDLLDLSNHESYRAFEIEKMKKKSKSGKNSTFLVLF